MYSFPLIPGHLSAYIGPADELPPPRHLRDRDKELGVEPCRASLIVTHTPQSATGSDATCGGETRQQLVCVG